MSWYAAMFIRMYLTYYNIKYQIMTSSAWKNVINPSHCDEIKKSWFFMNKTKWGSQRYLIRVTIIWVITIACISIIIGVMDIVYGGHIVFYYWIVLVSVDTISFVFAVFYLFYHLKKLTFHDDFHVLPEFSMLRYVIIAYFVISSVYVVIFMLLSSILDGLQMKTYILINFHANYVFGCCVLTITTYIMSRYVINQLRADKALRSQYGQILNTTPSISSSDNELKSVSSGKTQVSLQRIMCKTEYLDVFMKHLAQEFSLELALSLIEFIQFKNYMEGKKMQNLNINTHIIDVDAGQELQIEIEERRSIEFSSMTLCEDIPKSSIVYDTEHDETWKATQLFMKYIRVGAPYEINVSSKLREALTMMFAGKAVQSRFSLTRHGLTAHNDDKDENDKNKDLRISPMTFVRCCEEMGKLLGYSLSRFKTKPDYVKLVNFENENADIE